MSAAGNKERRKYLRHPVQIPIVCRCRNEAASEWIEKTAGHFPG